MLRRRKWWLITPLVLCLVAGALAGARAAEGSTIGRDDRRRGADAVARTLKGVSSLDATERQRAISQHLLSRHVLERVVREEQTRPDEADRGSRGLAAQVGSSSTCRTDRRAARAGDAASTASCWATRTRQPATQKIANRLAYVFVEENSKRNTERAENTSEVLASSCVKARSG